MRCSRIPHFQVGRLWPGSQRKIRGFQEQSWPGVFLMLLFPDGRLLSRRWRIVAWMAVCGAVLRAVADGLPSRTFVEPTVTFRTRSSRRVRWRGHNYDFFAASTLVGKTLLFTSSLAALFSLFLRLHRAQGDERQQLKWFLYAACSAVVFLSLVLSYSMGGLLTTEFLFT